MSGNGRYEPFDGGDPFNVMADLFRRQVAELAIAAQEMPIFKRLSPQEQIACFVAGVEVGLLGVCYASIEPNGQSAMLKFIRSYLDQAEDQARAMTAARPVTAGDGR